LVATLKIKIAKYYQLEVKINWALIKTLVDLCNKLVDLCNELNEALRQLDQPFDV
jgi:hypothetical protein